MATNTSLSNWTNATIQRFTATIYGDEDNASIMVNEWKYKKFRHIQKRETTKAY